MKYFKQLFKTILFVFFASISMGFPLEMFAQEPMDVPNSQGNAPHLTDMEAMDGVEISLLTCSPGDQIWSLYGHTAIRYTDHFNNVDLVINYGMFSFSQPNFILRFVFGRTDYQMGIEPFDEFCYEYVSQGRTVVQQRLRLTPEEKLNIKEAIGENYQPQNRVYRYNFFYDNCTTRARDMLINHLIGKKVDYREDPRVTTSYREMVHQWNADHRWARFGNDLLLGVAADFKTDSRQQQFLPDSLRADFAKAVVIDKSGKRYPLVDSTFEVVEPTEAVVQKDKGLWDVVDPWMVFAALLVLTLVISAVELRRKRTFWLYDVVLLTLDGLAGLCIFAMIFSSHPTVQVNLQLLLLNPLSILLVFPVGRSAFRQQYHRYWTVLFICLLLFFVGIILQHPAEGMPFLACSLMVRCYMNYRLYNHKSKQIR